MKSRRALYLTGAAVTSALALGVMGNRALGSPSIVKGPTAAGGLYASSLRSAAAFDAGAPTRIAFQRSVLSGGEDHPQVFLMNADGSGVVNVSNDISHADYTPALSVDGTRLAFVRDGDIYVKNLGTGQLTRLTFTCPCVPPPNGNSSPAWSYEGTQLAYAGSDGFIYRIPSTGGPATLVAKGSHPSWAPNGTKIAFQAEISASDEVWTIELGTGQTTQITHDTRFDGDPSWSPNGARLAFSCDRGGVGGNEICIVDLATMAETWIDPNAANGDSQSPTWSPDGAEIAFGSYRGPSGGSFFKYRIYVMAQDGSQLHELTNDPGGDTYPYWGGPSPPATTVAVASFVAKRVGLGISLRWRTASETAIAGFNLYRSTRGELPIKLNPALIQARHAGTTRRAQYTYVDRTARRSTAYRYQLEVVGLNDENSWAGSSNVRVS